MKKLAFNIEYTINFQNTVNEIKFQLLDGIAYFKSNKNIIVNEIVERCGNGSKMNKQYKNDLRIVNLKKRNTLNSNKLELHKFFIEITEFLNSLNGFWKVLMTRICRSLSTNSDRETCWDGYTFKM